MDDATGKMLPCESRRKIFISYRHSDKIELPLCELIASYILDRLDVAIWYDLKLTPGKSYDDEILSAIKSSDVFVLLLTPSILSSAYILEKEIPAAIENQLTVIPIIVGIDESEISKVEKILGRIQMPIWFFGKQKQYPISRTSA